MNRSNPEPQEPPRFKEVWVELRTPTERIEGAVRMKVDARCRRIGDVVMQADRDGSGILHLVQATVFDAQTNAVKFHRSSLGISRQQVIFAAPLEMPSDSNLGWNVPPKQDRDRIGTPNLSILDALNTN